MRVIVNADDFGMSQQVNDAISALLEAGRVSSATLIMNGPAIEEAVARLKRYPRASFGVHLNAMEFRPLVEDPGLRVLTHDDGNFRGNLRQVKITQHVREGVYAEWCAQIKRALTMGVAVSHLDSHFHTHNMPLLFPVLKRLQRKFGIRKVRLTQNIYAGPVARRLLAFKAVWNLALRNIVRTRTTDIFGPFIDFLSWLENGGNPSGDIELMCHPGSSGNEQETAALESDWLERLGCAELISYHQL
jgi:predicted glycoside hydrolase/deacetylase ChbG (UPF0249 family)